MSAYHGWPASWCSVGRLGGLPLLRIGQCKKSAERTLTVAVYNVTPATWSSLGFWDSGLAGLKVRSLNGRKNKKRGVRIVPMHARSQLCKVMTTFCCHHQFQCLPNDPNTILSCTPNASLSGLYNTSPHMSLQEMRRSLPETFTQSSDKLNVLDIKQPSQQTFPILY